MHSAARHLSACFAAALLTGGGAHAGHLPGRGPGEVSEQVLTRPLAAGLSLDEAIERVQRQFGARVVRAETREDRGRTVYVLRLLSPDGRVWTVRVDAQSGRTI